MKKMEKTVKKLNKSSKKSDTYHHGDLRSALLDMALKMLKTQSPDQLSLRELARKAGVSQAAPYRHFKDKAELFAAISVQGFDLKYNMMRTAIESHTDPRDKIFACALAYFNMGLMHPQHFNLMCRDGIIPSPEYPELMDAAARTFILLQKLILEAQNAKVIGSGNPFHKAMNCWSVVQGYTSLYSSDRLKFLGITQKNAEAGLKTLVSQYLIGAQESLEKSQFGCELFQTEYSMVIKQYIDNYEKT